MCFQGKNKCSGLEPNGWAKIAGVEPISYERLDNVI